jgi:prepilin-type N-terminal cleavage/methylation domain-containing protein
MNTSQLHPGSLRRQAFTLVEIMVAMSIFSLVSIGMLYTHLFCLRQDSLINSKLGASDQSRRGFDLLTRDIRSAKVWEIGNVNSSGGGFTGVDLGTSQKGNAVWLSYTATNDHNVGMIYYFNTSSMATDGGKLYRYNLNTGVQTLIAQDLTNTMRFTNSMCFQAQNYRGEPQTDRTHKGVVNVLLEFAQYQYPLTKVGPGYFYDYYKMEFKLTSHCPDGP